MKPASTGAVIRYCALFDGTNHKLTAEIAASLVSLRLYLLPYIGCKKVVLYTKECYRSWACNLLNVCLGDTTPCEVIALDELEFEYCKFLESLDGYEITKICVLRLLADARLLGFENHRLHLGNDILFRSPPHELINFLYTTSINYPADCFYLADDYTFTGRMYSLGRYSGKFAKGIISDFFALSPHVRLSENDILGAVRLVNSISESDRWQPKLPWPAPPGFAIDQLALGVLMGGAACQSAPHNRYNHVVIRKNTCICHTKISMNKLARMDVNTACAIHDIWEKLSLIPRDQAETKQIHDSNIQTKVISGLRSRAYQTPILQKVYRRIKRVLSDIMRKVNLSFYHN